MDTPCPACLKAPIGIDGHADLRVQGMGGTRMSFKCGTCGSLWARTSKGAGGFVWFAMGERNVARLDMGNAVPPCSNPAPAFKWWPRDGGL